MKTSLVAHPAFAVGTPGVQPEGNPAAADAREHRGKKDGHRRKRNKGRG